MWALKAKFSREGPGNLPGGRGPRAPLARPLGIPHIRMTFEEFWYTIFDFLQLGGGGVQSLERMYSPLCVYINDKSFKY